MYNFKDVEIPVTNSYLKPGFWKLAPTKAELVKKEGKTSYLDITFEGTAGKLTHKFFLSEKALSRLQYLHEGLYQKRLEKDFNSDEEVANYFNTLFEKKKIVLNFLVGGETSTKGTVYANLPFTGFILGDDNFEEGAFEEGSARYKEVVKGSTAPQSNATVVTDEDVMPWDM